jgi:hypothetical protein
MLPLQTNGFGRPSYFRSLAFQSLQPKKGGRGDGAGRKRRPYNSVVILVKLIPISLPAEEGARVFYQDISHLCSNKAANGTSELNNQILRVTRSE